ncbi:MAG: prephenate dehydratase [Selenomonadaceae bacterium]|nr:prephenate dehydratase [Selenomonadaceae bacterium]
MKRMGILGPRGTHSEAAAVWLNAHVDEPRELVICSDIYDVLRAVEEGELDAGLVPVENSLEGSINITLDTLARSDHLTVAREVIWRVHNQLMARTGVVEVKKIISHAQPISQCRRYIRKNYPSAELETVQSTARAAEIAAASDVSDGVAAICTKRAGELNDLIALATEIQDNIFNSTRFFEVANARAIGSTVGDKVLIICQIHGERPGALCEVLEEFAFRRVNMTRIESRPARTKLGEYIFFFDLDANVPPDVLEQSIDAVTRRSIWLKRLGAFPVLAADNV